MRLKSAAWTLIEILAVIGITVILAAILAPIFKGTRVGALVRSSSNNIRSLTSAALVYAADNTDTFPPVFTHASPVNGGRSEIVGADSLVMPYVRSSDVWHSPLDRTQRVAPDPKNFNDGIDFKKALPRSYAFIGNIKTTAAAGFDSSTGMGVGFPHGLWDQPGRPMSLFEEPVRTAFMVESWRKDRDHSYVGSLYYAAVWNCWTWLLPGRPKDWRNRVTAELVPADCLAEWAETSSNPGNGRGKGVYSFVDGHVELVDWTRAVEDDFELLRAVNRKS